MWWKHTILSRRHAAGVVVLAVVSVCGARAIADTRTIVEATLGEMQQGWGNTYSPTLTLTLTDGTKTEAPTIPEQVGFSAPLISSDGKRVGWFANRWEPDLIPVGVLPETLVIWRDGRIERIVPTGPHTATWNFADRRDAVVYWTEPLHFSISKQAWLVEVETGKILDSYDVPDANMSDDDAMERRQAILDRAPAWTKVVPDFRVDD